MADRITPTDTLKEYGHLWPGETVNDTLPCLGCPQQPPCHGCPAKRGHALTIYVPDHATKEQVEHIQETLQIAVDKLPDRAFIIVDLPKGLSADLAIELKREMQQIADEVSREFPGA